MSISVLVLCELGPAQEAALRQRHQPTFALTPEERARVVKTHGAEFEAVLTIGLSLIHI